MQIVNILRHMRGRSVSIGGVIYLIGQDGVASDVKDEHARLLLQRPGSPWRQVGQKEPVAPKRVPATAKAGGATSRKPKPGKESQSKIQPLIEPGGYAQPASLAKMHIDDLRLVANGFDVEHDEATPKQVLIDSILKAQSGKE